MPLLIKDYTWRQTENVVVIRVPLKGVHYSKVDIFTCDNYIKAHFQPFIFEAFLFALVREGESKCTLTDGEIVFELYKVETNLWERLENNLSKAEQQEMRKKILEKAQDNAKAEKEKKCAKKAELDRLAVRQQISIDTRQQKYIEEIKENEKKTAMKELEEWKTSQQPKNNKVVPGSVTEDEIFNEKKAIKAGKNSPKTPPLADKCTLEEMDEIMIPVPLPRSSGTITVNFTSRAFPTPKRESQVSEEEEWLKKQAEARRRVGFVVEDLTPEELDPVWLKDKGDSFFKIGNYLGAISAYSHAIKLGSKMPAMYSNRAAAHMAIGNLHKTVEDCSKALELLTPCVSMNALSRARCHARRGTALCKLGLMREGMEELRAAVALQPDDDKLRMDLEKARAMVDAFTDTDELE